MNEKIRVGFSRVDITPEQYGPMGGLGDDARRICTHVMDRPLGTCIAITDEKDQTVLLCPSDLIHAKKNITSVTREAITAATGIPGDHIMIAASHNHSGPSISAPDLEPVQAYYRHYARQMVKAAKEALDDRKPAQVYVGRHQTQGMTFVRHYLMNDGTYAGSGFGSFQSGCKAHLDVPDEQMQMIRFCREGGRDVLLLNWQSHVTICSSMRTEMSADYVGVLRNHVEGSLGCHFAFFQGAAGNLVPHSRIEGESATEKNHEAYGKKLAEYVMEGIKNLSPVKAGPIRTRQQRYEGAVDHSDDHLAEKAKNALEHFYDFPLRSESNRYIREQGFNSMLHARGVVRRANLGESIDMEINALSVGDISFITAPYEMFCSNGKFIKENTPYEMTFVLTCCNDTLDYLADKKAFGYSCYEVNTRRFHEGTAEDVANIYIEMLKELKKQDS